MNDHPNIITMPDTSPSADHKGVGYVYYHSMLKYQHRVAQIDALTNKQENYCSLLNRSTRAAITMQNKGIGPGDFVSICSRNTFDACVPCIAALFIGAIMAPVDPAFSVTETVYLLKQLSPKMIFVAAQSVRLIEEVVKVLETGTTIVTFGETVAHTPFDDFLQPYSNEMEFSPRQPESIHEMALLLFTSGTTGRPKGICHSHSSILSNPMFPETRDCLTIATFCSVYWVIYHRLLHNSIVNGFKMIIFEDFDCNDPWKVLEFRVDYALIIPFEGMSFVKHPKPEHADVTNLKVLALSGNTMSKEQLLLLKAQLPKTFVAKSYGQSEVFTRILGFPQTAKGFHLVEKYPNSVGIPSGGFSYKIVDVETEEILAANSVGELMLKSKNQTNGYYKCDSSEMFDADGWLKTGDLAYYNEEHCFFITGRIKESFKYIDYHVIPVEIENVLAGHPAVQNVVVLGLPHHTDENHPIAVVEVCQKVTTDELVKYVEERVEDRKRLRGGVKIVQKIPLTVSGKFSRYKLREMLIHQRMQSME
ncbi:hypothetical protein PPYR_12007 [Photinus pyralis]|uniref:Luciferin 4-monooxygenase n=1 Tax=Photinus pyralis TaxID=7054 RepID=A0A5N4AD38_PHOPY|nr:luciferin 4-monooxygenase-like [Photinus pyralis]KAB0795168.1 hypothetical protein PPYR_12007 [Photinus pyralis]